MAEHQDKSIKNKEIIEIQDDWPWYHRLIANVVNAGGIFFWAIISFLLLYHFNSNAELAGLRDAYLNLVVPHSMYVIFTLIAGMALGSWLMPWFSPRRIMRTGTPLEKAMCMGFWAALAIAIGISLLSVA